MSFPQIGTSAASATPALPDAAHTTLVAKAGSKNSGPDNAGTAVARQGSLERLGATYAPKVGYEYPTAPEASQTYRNVHLVPSAIGNRDFWDKRQFGQNAQ